jgi:CheY-like chemotaxis protein
VLVVGDEADQSEVPAECLRLDEYRVAEAADGCGAEILHGGARPAMILLDLIMNGRRFPGIVREDLEFARIAVASSRGRRRRI